MTPALLLAAMMGVWSPVVDSIPFDNKGCPYLRLHENGMRSCSEPMKYVWKPGIHIIDPPPDTIGYWLNRYSTGGMCPGACDETGCTLAYCPPVEVVDTIPVMRKR